MHLWCHFSYELLHWREVLHIWSVNWDPVENQVWIENNCSKSRIHTISVKCDIVRVWRRHWFDDTTQFTFICNHLKIDTEPQQVCTRKWIADEGSDTFLGQTFDNRKWWPDSSQRASEQASLKRGLEIVPEHIYGSFVNVGLRRVQVAQVSHSSFQLAHTVSPDVAAGPILSSQPCLIQAICHFEPGGNIVRGSLGDGGGRGLRSVWRGPGRLILALACLSQALSSAPLMPV